MRHRFNLLGSLAFVCWIGSGVAQAKVWEYKLKGFPKSEGNCHEAALAVGAKFAEATGTTVLRSRCLNDSSEGYEIQVDYEAEDVQPLVSTGLLYSGVYGMGRFPDRETCEKAKSGSEKSRGEVELFESETGLPAVFSWCVREAYGDKRPWYLRIDGFGSPKKRPYLSGFHYFGIPHKVTGTHYKSTVASALAQRGITLVDIVFRSHLAYGTAAALYYSETQIELNLVEATRAKTMEQCLSQLEDMVRVLTAADDAPVYHYCGVVQVGGYAETTLLFVDGPRMDIRPSAESFKTYDDCEEERAALVRYYQEKLKLPVVGGYCSMKEDHQNYAVILFEKNY